MAKKKITSQELVEIRTVLTRAKTALVGIRAWKGTSEIHTDHELSMMESALITTIGVLQEVEQLAGYREAGNDEG